MWETNHQRIKKLRLTVVVIIANNLDQIHQIVTVSKCTTHLNKILIELQIQRAHHSLARIKLMSMIRVNNPKRRTTPIINPKLTSQSKTVTTKMRSSSSTQLSSSGKILNKSIVRQLLLIQLLTRAVREENSGLTMA